MLTKLELQNFKSHRHTEFNFDNSRLHAIVGQNSSGKTSVLQATNYLSQLSNLKKTKTIFGESKISQYEKQIQETTDIVRDNATNNSNHMKLKASGDDWFFLIQAYNNTDLNNWKGNRYWKIQTCLLDDNDMLGFFSQLDKVQWDNSLNSVFYFKPIVTNISIAAYSEEIAPEIKIDGSSLAPRLDYLKNEYTDQFYSLQKMLKQIVPSVRKIGTRRAKVFLDRQRLIEVDGKSIAYADSQEVIGQEIFLDMATGDRIPASAISEGTMLTLGLLTVLMNPQQPNLVLLDDIEQGLHPKAQRELITVFKQIVQANPKLQIIFTTHSPYIIDELEPSQVHVLSNAKDGFTRAKRLDEHPDIEWAKQTLTTGEFWDAEGEDWVVEAEAND
jgi:AAA15 family ATPase/GTPase